MRNILGTKQIWCYDKDVNITGVETERIREKKLNKTKENEDMKKRNYKEREHRYEKENI